MTVKELIERLSKFDGDKRVFLCDTIDHEVIGVSNLGDDIEVY